MKLVYFEEHKLHDLRYHPENSSRIESIREYLEKEFEFKKIKPEFDEEAILRVHSREYVDRVKNICDRVSRWEFLDPDTYVVRDSYKVAVLSANSMIKAYETNEKHVFVLTRPPGHHARRDSQGGFCIFNNVVILSEFVKDDGLNPLILDLDYHHGNGTQELVDEKITFISIHRFGVYPGTGLYHERDGKEVYNIPLEFSDVNDAEYLYVFEKVALPIIERKNPDVIIVSMGFDGYIYDSIGDWALRNVWSPIFKRLRDYRIIFALEGGYNPIGILEGIRSIKNGLSGKEIEIRGDIRKSLKKFADDLGRYFMNSI